MPSDILHVTESFAGGVSAAVQDYVHAYPNAAHHLLYADRPESPVSDQDLAAFASRRRLPSGHIRRPSAVRATVTSLGASVVHAHSSWAGLYVRVALTTRHAAIVYSPHCYAFERQDIGRITALGFRWAEAALALNTSVVAACSPREYALSQRLAARPGHVLVPNVAPMARRPIEQTAFRATDTLKVVGGGRLGPQKDPEFFRQTIEMCRRMRIPVTATWIGGGDARLENSLAQSGVVTTGWLPRDAAISVLASADVYLHSARWEGFPVAVLEADALGVPALVRDIPSFQGTGLPLRVKDSSHAARAISLLQDPASRHLHASSVRAALANNTRAAQSVALHAAYDI